MGHRLGLEGLALHVPGVGLEPDQHDQAVRAVRDAELEQAWQRACQREAVAALHGAGLQAVALKGPELAQRLYPPGVVRRSTDIDVLVRPHDRDHALAVLQQLDWKLADHNLRHHHHVTLHRPASPPLELHWAALHALGTRVTTADLLTDAGTLEPHAELVYLAAHAASHHFERPLWVLDLAAFVSAVTGLDRRRLDGLAARWHVIRAWRQAQQQVVAMLGPEAWPWPVDRPDWHDRLSARGQRAYRERPKGSRTRFLLHVAGLAGRCDSVWRAAWLGQFAVLQAVGDLAGRRGLPVPSAWPPWPPWPPSSADK